MNGALAGLVGVTAGCDLVSPLGAIIIGIVSGVVMMVGSDLPYLLCVLNSPLSEWFFSKVGTTTGVGTVRWKKYTIQELLIPSVNVKLRQLFQQIVEKYVIGNITSEQLSKYSNKILYEVVGLIDEEIEFVENFYPPLI